jgi:signal transduction histidine kinase
VAVNGGIRVSAELDPLPPITADEEQVRKILDNLLLNAVEALPGEGEVRVRTATGNGSVSLEISDNGPGIPETILQGGLFIPFRTTKPKGLGIGLFQVKSIVEAHGGHIHIVSQKAKGTTIRVEFPLKSKE